MKFRANDELLSMATIRDERKGEELYVLTATDGGFGKRTNLDEYRSQGRGGIGVKAARVDENSRGGLIGALVVKASDEILLITSSGVVMRTPTKEVRETGRDTKGVKLISLSDFENLASISPLISL